MSHESVLIRIILLCFSVILTGGCSTAKDSRSGPREVAARGNRHDEKVYFEMGVEFAKQQKWNESIENLDKAIAINPSNAESFEYRATALFVTGDLDRALEDYSRALSLDPTNINIYLERGALNRARGDFDGALSDFSRYITSNSSNAFAYKNRAACFHSKADLINEIEDWNSALRLNPKDDDVMAHRGWAYFMAGQFEQAIRDFKKAIEINSKNALAYNQLAWVRATCPAAEFRNGQEAVVAASKACELTDWKTADYIDTLATAYAEAGDFPKAIEYEFKALEVVESDSKSEKYVRRHLSMFKRNEPDHDGQRN